MRPSTRSFNRHHWTEKINEETSSEAEECKAKEYKLQLKYANIIGWIIVHSIFLYGLYVILTGSVKWQTFLFAWILYWFSGFGGTAGAHRLWTHRAFKATFKLRLLLCYFNCTCYIGSIYDWVRDHRVHHKYTETDADPHNALRGFFFSHIGWLMCKKHPEVIAKGKLIDMSDVEADPIVRIQRKYYYPLVFLCCFAIPTLVPHLFWSETVSNAFLVPGIVRWVIQLHAIFLVNSAAHLYGRHPYDKNINPAENFFVSAVVGGEGFHNYHHVFPWDYRASELGWLFNPTKTFIDAMAAIGWAYDLKTAKPSVIRHRKEKCGDIHEFGPYGYY
ncbi:stearoyl-CoA desaturase-like protein [Dinothrombium tinctorium]|uniref:Stearoyl-CoA desaturase-like protein n=1 Tax=Dinothrombium tinctorium TaxID=1965070 RepID=A0A443RCU5_9ACAR|nr:stearoyl-CoA desaturase-like protein [Dinothrombium tinctorium]